MRRASKEYCRSRKEYQLGGEGVTDECKCKESKDRDHPIGFSYMVFVDEDGENDECSDEEENTCYHFDQLSFYFFGYLTQQVPSKSVKQETRPVWKLVWLLSGMGGLL